VGQEQCPNFGDPKLGLCPVCSPENECPDVGAQGEIFINRGTVING
jgi:hypothetical protein